MQQEEKHKPQLETDIRTARGARLCDYARALASDSYESLQGILGARGEYDAGLQNASNVAEEKWRGSLEGNKYSSAKREYTYQSLIMPHFLSSIAYFNQILIPYVLEFEHLGLAFSLIMIIIAFIECIPIIGYILPGTIIFYGASAFAIKENLIPNYVIFMVIGGFSADMVSYYLGKKGNEVMMRHVEKRKELFEKVHAFFSKYGVIGMIAGKNIGFARPMIAFVAGTSEMGLKKFMIASWIACCIWPFQYLLFAIYLRRYAGLINVAIHRFGLSLLLLVVAYFLIRKLINLRNQQD